MTTALDTRPASAHLLAAIIAAPEDDAPRLIYADAIEEAEPERAAFIRVQCRLAGCQVCDGTGRNVMSPCPCSLLRRRERDLLQANAREWLPIPGLSACSVWDHSPTIRWFPAGDSRGEKTYVVGGDAARGFIASIACTTAAFVGGVCAECVGEGWLRHGPITRRKDCPACSGTGRRPGCAGALFRQHPIERVTLSDREPYRYVAAGLAPRPGINEGQSLFRWWCYRNEAEAPPEHEPALLPEAIYEPLRKQMPFPTAEAAKEALNRVAVAYGRAAATEGG